MKVVIDSFAVLKAIGSNPYAFDAVDEVVRKQSSAILVARFKHKSLDLKSLRAVCEALGLESVELFFDTVDAALLKAICKKCDPHAPELKAGDVEAIKQNLLALAKGKDAALKSTKATVKSTKSKVPTADTSAHPARHHDEAT